MRFIQHKYFPYCLLALLAVPLFFLSIYDFQTWGDDFAQYIKEALNLAHGKPYYLSAYIFNPHNTIYAPPQYPPGYPLMLIPIVSIWGISYRAIDYYNTCITVGLLFSLFAFFRKRSGMVASICLSVLITYSGYLVRLKGNALSDLPCLLFVVLYLTSRNAAIFSRKRITLLIFLAAAAMLIRTQAALLLVSEAIYFLFSAISAMIKERKITTHQFTNSPALFIIAGGLALFLFLDKVIFPAPTSTVGFYNQFIHSALQTPVVDTAKNNFSILLQQIAQLFHYETYYAFPKALMSLIESAAVTFTFAGFIISASEKLTIDHIFFVLMCLLTLYYPVHDCRYLLPAQPLLFYYCYISIKALLPAIPKIKYGTAAIILTVICVAVGADDLKNSATTVPPGCIPHQNDLAAFQYLDRHINNGEIVVFTKPRLLALYTSVRSVNTSWTFTMEQNKTYFDSLHAKYLLIVDGLDDGYFKPYVHHFEHPIDSNSIADGYTLYTLR